MPKGQLYVCPRCNYQSALKKCMRQHFEKLKKPCPNAKNLELTEQIKQEVLNNHFYFPDKGKRESSDERVVNYNTTNNNFIAQLDGTLKLNSYLEYSGKQTVDINDFVEAQHLETVKKLDQNLFRSPYLIESQDFLVLFDAMVRVNEKQHEEMNVIYDDILDRIRIYCDDTWSSYLIEPGLKRLVTILRTNYLDPYECYLYYKLFFDKDINGYQLNNVRIYLEEYYRFLAIYEHMPLIYSEPIENIVKDYKTENPDEFRDYGMPKYSEIKNELTKSDINKHKKLVLDIIKRNHKLNLKLLNETILNLIRIDSEFKRSLFSPDLSTNMNI